MRATAANGTHRSGFGDPMIRTKRELAVEPVRIVVELHQDEYAALDRATGHWLAPADYLKLVALRLVAEAKDQGLRPSRAPRRPRNLTRT